MSDVCIVEKQQNGKVSMNNAVLGCDYKFSINMLMKQLYIAVQYCYILNRITLGELININKLEMNKMNSTKSIVS